MTDTSNGSTGTGPAVATPIQGLAAYSPQPLTQVSRGVYLQIDEVLAVMAFDGTPTNGGPHTQVATDRANLELGTATHDEAVSLADRIAGYINADRGAPLPAEALDEADLAAVGLKYGPKTERCHGGRIVAAGQPCPHCGSASPATLCEAPRSTTQGQA